ncbi:hypothetical protein Patl1_24536 [Pistacia atlantica]|uniref:Uncharacterized protein n=1 Tax=Pistacia atlantica TaxID=434234 RepID=A0ACC1A278_9ROSI|nr:hypothetical protein Patl1_24536 [Pistacia atlantica]
MTWEMSFLYKSSFKWEYIFLQVAVKKVGVALPTIEARYKNFSVEADCEIDHGKPLPTLWNSLKNSPLGAFISPCLGSFIVKSSLRCNLLTALNDFIVVFCCTTKGSPPLYHRENLAYLFQITRSVFQEGSSLFLAICLFLLLFSSKVTGKVSSNVYRLDEFVPQKTSAYINQEDLHIAEMTEGTLDFSAQCLGVGNRGDMMMEVSKREKEAGIVLNPDVDTYMKAISAKGQKSALQTNHVLKVLEQDICIDTMVGDEMRRGISGGQKRRLTGDATVLISLLQPPPKTFELFDDIILMVEGKVVYQGPRDQTVEFFEDCGFRCPQRIFL